MGGGRAGSGEGWVEKLLLLEMNKVKRGGELPPAAPVTGMKTAGFLDAAK